MSKWSIMLTMALPRASEGFSILPCSPCLSARYASIALLSLTVKPSSSLTTGMVCHGFIWDKKKCRHTKQSRGFFQK